MIGTRLAQKVAVVTGAGGGIGRKSALLFAKEGAKGIVCADLNLEAAQETASMVSKLVGRSNAAVAIGVDVSKNADCKRMIDLAEKSFGKLHVLFNNAGLMHSDDDDAISTSESVWDLTYSVCTPLSFSF
jgi:NAD(P)-dependent dehydrogenase (short-subunit alcohol dehydrogenase family)